MVINGRSVKGEPFLPPWLDYLQPLATGPYSIAMSRALSAMADVSGSKQRQEPLFMDKVGGQAMGGVNAFFNGPATILAVRGTDSTLWLRTVEGGEKNPVNGSGRKLPRENLFGSLLASLGSLFLPPFRYPGQLGFLTFSSRL